MAVSSVFGRTGVVGAQTGDYTADQISDTANKMMMTAAERARLAGFGAVGDGVTDDTAAFVAAAACRPGQKGASRAGRHLHSQAVHLVRKRADRLARRRHRAVSSEMVGGRDERWYFRHRQFQ
jgi:hypothetical protein